MLPALASAGVAATPGILGSFLTYFGMKEQNKLYDKSLNQQMSMFNTQIANEQKNFGETLSENKRQFDSSAALNKLTATNNFQLGKRAADTADRQVDAQIAESEAAREQAKADRIMSGKMLQLNNITRFFNTPETRSSFAALWR